MKAVNWSNVMLDGEKVVWSGQPKNVKLLNTSRKGMIMTMWLIAAIWIVASLAILVPKSLAIGDNWVHILVMLVILDCVPVLMVAMPFSDVKWLGQDTQYAVTNHRIIIQGREKMMSMAIRPDLKLEMKKREGDTGHIVIGTACGKSDTRMRPIAIQGMDTNHVVDGLVLYNVPQVENVMKSIQAQM